MDYTSFDDPHQEDGGGGSFLQQLPTILVERKWWIIIPALLGIIGAIGSYFLIPPVYRSHAIMLVESPQLPDQILNLDQNDMVDRRIAAIRQQITARPDLIELIERHGLYTDERKSSPLSDVLEEMRDSISLAPSEVTLVGGRADQRTIAFELEFEYFQPAQTQAVAQDLMDRVLQLDARGNAEQAANTVQFLTDQAVDMQTKIADVQTQISQVNARNGAVLSSNGLVMSGGTGNYDVQIAALQRENQSLIQQRNLADSADERDPVVTSAEQRLAGARAVYAETHPDVVIAKQNLAEARALAKESKEKLPLNNIGEQITFNNQQIAKLRSARQQEIEQMTSRLTAQSRAPLVQQKLGDLQQRLNALTTRYDEVQNQLLSAQAGMRAEDEQMAERLSVIEPPVVPDKPSWPDRWLLAVIGIGGGLGLGVVFALAVELLLRPIRDPETLKSIFGSSPLGVIPIIEAPSAPRKGLRRFARTG